MSTPQSSSQAAKPGSQTRPSKPAPEAEPPDPELVGALASLEGDGLHELQILESENSRLLDQLKRRRLERP
jgi:hypothetical protein